MRATSAFLDECIRVSGQCCMQKSGDFIQVPLQLFLSLTAVLTVVRVRAVATLRGWL